MSDTATIIANSSIDASIANTIIGQMGGFNALRLMVGMTNACTLPEKQEGEDLVLGGVSFRFKGSRKANHVSIKLMADDTYTVEFKQVGRVRVKDVARFTEVYADGLQRTFEETTGLITAVPGIIVWFGK